MAARELSDKDLIARYRKFVSLMLAVVEAPRVFVDEGYGEHLQHEHFRGRVEGDLRNYGKVVMISLSRHADGEALPDLPSASFPRFTRQVEDKSLWSPANFENMPEWDPEELLDPGDVRYRPAP